MSTHDDTADTTDALATPDEHLAAAIQMDKVREYTVRPGLLRVPVAELTTAPNSPQYLLQLDHPVIADAELRFFIEKPAYWDATAFLWPRFLDWYGYTTRSQYELQTDRVYVKHNPHTDTWDLTKPPSSRRRTWWRLRDAASHRFPRVARTTHRAWRTATTPTRRLRALSPRFRTAACLGLGLLTFVGLVPAATASPTVNYGVWGATLVASILGFVVMVLAALVVEPPTTMSDGGRQ